MAGVILSPGPCGPCQSVSSEMVRHELAGGYQRNANGARNPFYESMREVSPGDAIFSFVENGGDWDRAVVLLGKLETSGVR